MYNQNFLDTIDRLNSIAKSMGYTNGVAWARKQMEEGRINEYVYGLFNDCHDLRNLMAHGYSKDISISAETMQKAQSLLHTICNSNTSNNNQTSMLSNMRMNNNIRVNNKPEVQVGDYVIIMNANRVTLAHQRSYAQNGSVTIEVGTLFKVIEVNSTTAILEDLNNQLIYDIARLRKSSHLNLTDGLYVFKTNPIGFTPNNNTQVYIIDKPNLDKGIKNSPFIHITFTTDCPYGENLFNPCQYEELELKRVSYKGYLAHIDCFDKTKSKSLFDFTNGNEDEYLGGKQSSYTSYADDDPNDLPF